MSSKLTPRPNPDFRAVLVTDKIAKSPKGPNKGNPGWTRNSDGIKELRVPLSTDYESSLLPSARSRICS